MNDLTPNSTSEQVSALQRQVFSLLVALIVVSGTLTVYLYRQASLARKDYEAIAPQAQQVIGAFNQNQQLLVGFVNQLVAYAQLHPDFRPVLAKNGITPNAGGAVTPAVTPKK